MSGKVLLKKIRLLLIRNKYKRISREYEYYQSSKYLHLDNKNKQGYQKNIKMLFNIKVLVLILTIIINLSDCQVVKYVIEVSCLNTDILLIVNYLFIYLLM